MTRRVFHWGIIFYFVLRWSKKWNWSTKQLLILNLLILFSICFLIATRKFFQSRRFYFFQIFPFWIFRNSTHFFKTWMKRRHTRIIFSALLRNTIIVFFLILIVFVTSIFNLIFFTEQQICYFACSFSLELNKFSFW